MHLFLIKKEAQNKIYTSFLAQLWFCTVETKKVIKSNKIYFGIKNCDRLCKMQN